MSKLYIFSGAGLSAESGIQTFRGKGGLWNNVPISKVADFNTWQENKEQVFQFYNERRHQLNEVLPNPAHHFIAEIESELGEDRCINVTQNIDDLLERAGVRNVLHVHGFLQNMQCLDCWHEWNIGYSSVPVGTHCPKCGSSLNVKPGIVMFNEPVPNYSEMITIFSEVQKEDVILVIGTSGNVVPMKWITGVTKRSYNILVNLDQGMVDLSAFDIWFKEPAGTLLPKIKELILEKLS